MQQAHAHVMLMVRAVGGEGKWPWHVPDAGRSRAGWSGPPPFPWATGRENSNLSNSFKKTFCKWKKILISGSFVSFRLYEETHFVSASMAEDVWPQADETGEIKPRGGFSAARF